MTPLTELLGRDGPDLRTAALELERALLDLDTKSIRVLLPWMEEQWAAHRRREEEDLFPDLLECIERASNRWSMRQADPRTGGPWAAEANLVEALAGVACALEEHEELVAWSRRLVDFVPAHPGPWKARSFRKLCPRYLRVYDAHLHRDETLVYPLAERLLPPSCKRRVIARLRDRTAVQPLPAGLERDGWA